MAYHWGGRQGPTPTANTGPSGDHTSGTGGYVYVESSGGALNSVASLVSPPISTVGIISPELIFWRHQFGATMGLLRVFIRPYDPAATIAPWDTLHVGSNADLGNSWNRVAITLPTTYQNDTLELLFQMTKPATAGAGGSGPFGVNNQLGDLAIDDVSIDQLIACPAPTALTATRLTANSIQLSWTSGGATNWRVEYGPSGFINGAGTKINVGTNPFTVAGLNPSTSYEFRVKDSCNATDVSTWTARASAMTDCGPISSPWVENFDGPNWSVPAA
ncbi:MAG: fibronectin type III domain-containing protein, partial [Schleiferiaceae bacterium]|nr:fibronectin type III domain-containing protein [Schleiferiaceae bacterium]